MSWMAKRVKIINTDRILISDIDGTLIGDEPALQRLRALLNKNESFAGFGIAQVAHQNDIGNIARMGLPVPDLLITSVGSEIYYGPNIAYDMGWHQLIDLSLGAESIA